MVGLDPLFDLPVSAGRLPCCTTSPATRLQHIRRHHPPVLLPLPFYPVLTPGNGENWPTLHPARPVAGRLPCRALLFSPLHVTPPPSPTAPSTPLPEYKSPGGRRSSLTEQCSSSMRCCSSAIIISPTTWCHYTRTPPISMQPHTLYTSRS